MISDTLPTIDTMGRPIRRTDPFFRVMEHVVWHGECLAFTGFVNRKGYGRVANRGGPSLVHRIVWEHHNGPAPSHLVVMHSCDNPPCVELSHLSLGTSKDNAQDMVRKGRGADMRGAKNGQTKLTDAQIAEIRRLHALGERCSIIGKQFGVGGPHISRVVRGLRRPTGDAHPARSYSLGHMIRRHGPVLTGWEGAE